MSQAQSDGAVDSIAVIGMSGRFPLAGNVSEFWRNVRGGVECISRFSAVELEAPDAEGLSKQADYVRARSVVEGADLFDAAFFGILPREAELIDPQQRVFLECCWEALEDAGYDPQDYSGAIALYAGCSTNTYFLRNLCVGRGFIEDYTGAYPLGNYAAMLGAIADSLTTRVSYKLNLKGPSFTLQSACSTSLVAVCQACQSLLSYQSDMALAGGVSITFPQRRGYRYQDGAMGSPDGHCRAFDAGAQGTVFGSGAGVVLLKRLEDALAEGDHVYAIIKGFAVNNDGSGKVGYTAPSADGQAKVIAMAHAVAGVPAETITYVEAHGTATPLGDPIEFSALTRAFRSQTSARGFCALGTVKMNIGHLESAAGVAGLINAVQALVHRQLPPAIHFKTPNPGIDLANSPFYVNTRLSPWERGATPRRAGVSSFGVGGTNAHVILEEAPPAARPERPRAGHVLVLSARSREALEKATENLAAHLKANPEIDLGSVAYTLQAGRRAFEHRRALVCADVGDAVRALEGRDPRRVLTGRHEGNAAPVVFMFPGQGSQYVNMGVELYRTEPRFRDDVDACSEILAPHLGRDLRAALYPDGGAEAPATLDLRETSLAQPALFVIGYALAGLWMRRGVRPQAMIGHSVGEFVCACLSGVLSLEDALAIIAARGRMMQQLPPGGMLSVRLGEKEVTPFLNGELSIAAVNSPRLSVVSGPEAAIDHLVGVLDRRGVALRRLSTSHAFHSSMMDPLIEPFTEYLKPFRFNEPTLPYISGMTGTWATAKEATDPSYWASHLREPVRFSEGIAQLLSVPGGVFLEVGPGNALCTLARQHRDGPEEPATIASFPDATDRPQDAQTILHATGRLWLNGVTPNWSDMHGGEARRCSLPTYPFERKRYWVDPPPRGSLPPAPADNLIENEPKENMNTLIEQREMREPGLVATHAPARADRVRAALVEVFEDLSGLSLAGSDASATFLEMGFDSLSLTQVSQALQSRFGLPITFRQLLDGESTLDALSAFVDARLPADAFPAEAPRPPVAEGVPTPRAAGVQVTDARASDAARPAVVPFAAAGQGAMEAVVREQLQAMSQLMSKQLDALRGIGVAAELPTSGAPHTAHPPAVTAASPKAAAVPGPVKDAAVPGPAAGPQEFKPFGLYKPVQRGLVGGLNERQGRYLDGLIGRYVARTARSKEFTQGHRRVLADPRVAAGFRSQWKEMVYPIVTVRSRGSRLLDVDGNEYIDMLNGFGPILLGHAPSFVTEAIEKQLSEGFEIGPQTPLAGKVAGLICELTGMERVTFCNTGSEAVMAAVRVARTVTARKRIVLFAGSYHGTFDEVLVRGIRKGGAPHSLPIAPGIPNEKAANVTVLDYGTPEALEYIRAHAGELAAVLVEPVQSRHPALQPVEFLREVRRITAEAGTALIFDEVVTGFRAHPGGVQALFDIRADLATYGKVVGGGLPIGVLAGSGRFMDALDGGMWRYGDESFPEAGVTFFAGTFVRHPLALAAASAVLGHLKEQGPALQRALNERTTELVQALNAHFEERGVPTRIEHFASTMYFSFPTDQPYGSLLYYHLREKGIHIQEGFPCFLTTAHTDADLEQVIRAFKESVAEMQEGGVLPEAPRHEAARPTGSGPGSGSGVNGVSGARVPKEVPVTEPQLEIWLSAGVGDEANCAFNESFTLRMRGPLDRPALTGALQQLIDRHEALRSTFDPSRNCLCVHRHVPIDVPLVDLSPQAEGERDARVGQLIREDAASPFDMAKGPLVRARLVKLASDDHALLFTAHHMVCDGWSTNVLLGELSRLYDAACTGLACALPPPAPFSQYARSQAEWLGSPERAAVEAWWAAKYATPVQPLELPTDRPRGSVKSYRGDTVRKTVGVAEYQRIKRFGASKGCTLFATLLAGFKILLYRLTTQSDLVVGIPAAGQSLLEGGALVGHCVNFLPLRSSLEAAPTVGTFLTQVKHTLLDAYEHQNYTYGSLVRRLALPRDPSRLPLVEVQFNLERVAAGLEFRGLEVEVDPNPKGFVNFDLFLNVVESDHGLVLDCDYNSDLFDRETVDRWLGHYETLLGEMVAGPGRPVAALPLLSPAERHRLLVEWNETGSEFPRDACVHDLLEGQAARTPGAVAAEFEGRRLTYSELNGRANRLAHYLQKLGVGPGSIVGVYLDRSPEMLTAVLGVLKAGGAYVPLDPDYPNERITAVIEAAGPGLILSQGRVAPRLGPLQTRVICLDEAWPEVALEGDREPDTRVTPQDLAYLIFTSGSTGKPKGVPITHRSVVNLLCSMARQPGLDARDTLVAVTTLSFDIAVLELLLPLATGARVVIASREVASDGGQLLALLAASGATALQATPATWRLMLEAGWAGSPGLKALCGGEALPRDLADAILARASSLWNMYGPTETTVWSATSRVGPGSGPVPVGPPIANTEFYVLDESGQPVPVGVPGELYIGGEGLSPGYWNEPKLTAEKFVRNPFKDDPRSLLYKTGDSVRYHPDGTLEFLGRLDTQVKVRGFRIEASEVESVLVRYPGVRDCVVVAREDTPGDRVLVAYLVTGRPAPEPGDFRGFLAQTLPNYMVPSFFVCLEALPRTPNGKINRRELPPPGPANARRGRDYVPPGNPREQTLAEICAEVLRLDRVSVQDSLFDLGADSIRVFQIVARANDAGLNLTPKRVLAERTISAICADLGGAGDAAPDPEPQLAPLSRERYRAVRSTV